MIGKISVWKVVAIVACMVASFFSGMHYESKLEDSSNLAKLKQANEALKKTQNKYKKVSAELEIFLQENQLLKQEFNEGVSNEISNDNYTCRIPVGGLRIIRERTKGGDS